MVSNQVDSGQVIASIFGEMHLMVGPRRVSDSVLDASGHIVAGRSPMAERIEQDLLWYENISGAEASHSALVLRC